jgi:hypothetical protein
VRQFGKGCRRRLEYGTGQRAGLPNVPSPIDVSLQRDAARQSAGPRGGAIAAINTADDRDAGGDYLRASTNRFAGRLLL